MSRARAARADGGCAALRRAHRRRSASVRPSCRRPVSSRAQRCAISSACSPRPRSASGARAAAPVPRPGRCAPTAARTSRARTGAARRPASRTPTPSRGGALRGATRFGNRRAARAAELARRCAHARPRPWLRARGNAGGLGSRDAAPACDGGAGFRRAAARGPAGGGTRARTPRAARHFRAAARPAGGAGRAGRGDRARGAQSPGHAPDLPPAVARAPRGPGVPEPLPGGGDRRAAPHGPPAGPRGRDGAPAAPRRTGRSWPPSCCGGRAAQHARWRATSSCCSRRRAACASRSARTRCARCS